MLKIRKFFRYIRLFFFPPISIDRILTADSGSSWYSSYAGSTVSISILDDGGLALCLQRPIKAPDVNDGKLLPSFRTTIKRRGGKKQTEFTLSLEAAEMLYALLGKSLEEARIKHTRHVFLERLTDAFISSRWRATRETSHKTPALE